MYVCACTVVGWPWVQCLPLHIYTGQPEDSEKKESATEGRHKKLVS